MDGDAADAHGHSRSPVNRQTAMVESQILKPKRQNGLGINMGDRTANINPKLLAGGATLLGIGTARAKVRREQSRCILCSDRFV